jgi:hypothetical protein
MSKESLSEPGNPVVTRNALKIITDYDGRDANSHPEANVARWSE